LGKKKDPNREEWGEKDRGWTNVSRDQKGGLGGGGLFGVKRIEKKGRKKMAGHREFIGDRGLEDKSKAEK